MQIAHDLNAACGMALMTDGNYASGIEFARVRHVRHIPPS
jgi:hypothetical protein